MVNDYETGDRYLANGSKKSSSKAKAVHSKKKRIPEQHFKHKQANNPVSKEIYLSSFDEALVNC